MQQDGGGSGGSGIDPTSIQFAERAAQQAARVEQTCLAMADIFAAEGALPGAIFLGMLVAASSVLGWNWQGALQDVEQAFNDGASMGRERAIQLATQQAVEGKKKN